MLYYRPHCQKSLGATIQKKRQQTHHTRPSRRRFLVALLWKSSVYSGPPTIVYKFRHWGFMEGPFKGHAPTGQMVELYGMAIFQVDDTMKIEKVEFFYDRGELLGGLLKGTHTEKSGISSSSCPFMKNI